MTNVPTFLVLGAAKSGTTSFCNYIAQHEDVFFAPAKEPVFFEAEYENGMDFYRSKYFSEYAGQKASGEGRAFNLYLPFVTARIAESLPDARLIAILRDPVERAYSHWWHRYTRRDENRPFEAAVEADMRRVESGDVFEGAEGAKRWQEGLTKGVGFLRQAHPGTSRHAPYVDMGYYGEQIDRYLRHFPAENLRVYFYDELKADAEAIIQDAWGFVGVRPDFHLVDRARRNPARTARRGRAEYLAARIGWAGGLHRMMSPAAKDRLRRVFRQESVQRPPLAESTRRALSAHFAPHDDHLEKVIGRPIPYRQPEGSGLPE